MKSIFCASLLIFSITASVALLRKIQSSNARRILFVAGLANSGHRTVQLLLSHLMDEYPEQYVPLLRLNQLLFSIPVQSSFDPGLFLSDGVEMAAAKVEAVKDEFQRIANMSSSISFTELLFLGLEHCWNCGHMAYPNTFSTDQRMLDRPDLHVLAQYAEAVGLDFRVLVLQRPARTVMGSLLKQGLVTRKDPLVLIQNVEALLVQLKLIDRSFIHCIKVDELTTASNERLKQLRQFLHPGIGTEEKFMATVRTLQAQRTLDSFNDTHLGSFSKDYVDYFVGQLEARLRLIDAHCDQK